MTHRDFIVEPYKKCPECRAEKSFGVLRHLAGSKRYTRECFQCHYKEHYGLPNIKKKIIYLDQFVISNLVKLLDKSHPSHFKVKSDPFWKDLFIRLEKALKSQAIVCPDSFYHRSESLIGRTDFEQMKNLYEHFSNSNTLIPGEVVQTRQIVQHFEGWIESRKVEFDLSPENIFSGRKLHDWVVDMRVSVNRGPFPGEIEKQQVSNMRVRADLQDVWDKWQSQKDVKFAERVREEASDFWPTLKREMVKFSIKQRQLNEKIATGEAYDIDDVLLPLPLKVLADLTEVAEKKGLEGEEVIDVLDRYMKDTDAFLEVPKIRIGAVMFSGLAHRAVSGKRHPPKSTVDIGFISSYLPYFDALFVDKESASLLKELPKDTPPYLRLQEFPAKVFSLNNKDDFLDYLTQLIAEVPESQIKILKDMCGESYAKSILDDY
ncbi:MAG: hypothetical protein OXU50_01720 [Gammaproteobacteria bacterium]|nr:hypothetical protein [Gammaproteobacteria bacterium]